MNGYTLLVFTFQMKTKATLKIMLFPPMVGFKCFSYLTGEEFRKW